ncbi:MAG: amidohydrolase family protein [Pseudomonadota bacterium]
MDILIKNGKVIDGTGNPWFYADVLLKDGHIAEIAQRLDVDADRIVDATELYVAPGFVNPHDHVDGIVFFQNEMQPWITQGITTSMCGNCSFSPYPDKDTWLEHTRTNPEVELVTYSEKIREFPHDWSSLTEYADAVNNNTVGINVVPLVGHGTIRWKAGVKKDETPTPEQLEEIKALTREGLRQGAYGLSLGLSYPPCRFADREEIDQLAAIVAEFDGGIYAHISDLIDESDIYMLGEISAKHRIRVHIPHINPPGKVRFKDLPIALGALETARNRGADISFDVMQFSDWCFRNDAMRHFFWFLSHNDYYDTHIAGAESFESFLENLSSPDFKAQVKQAVTENFTKVGDFYDKYITESGYIWLINTGDEAIEGKTINELAAERNMDPVELFFDIVLQTGDLLPKDVDPGLVAPFLGGEDNIIKASNHPMAMPCLDIPTDVTDPDVAPWPQMYGTFPKFYRNLVAHGTEVEEAIRRMTSLPASRLGLSDRGRIERGYRADITIFDPAEYRTEADYYQPFTPAEGVHYVIVNGEFALERGKPTGARAGKVLLKQ